jgi:ABC-type transporter Mla MlaB component
MTRLFEYDAAHCARSADAAPPPGRSGAVAEPRAVILDGSRVSTIDLTACAALRDAIETVQRRGHVLALAGFSGGVRVTMAAFGIIGLLDPPVMCLSAGDAVDVLRPVLLERRGIAATARTVGAAAAAVQAAVSSGTV